MIDYTYVFWWRNCIGFDNYESLSCEFLFSKYPERFPRLLAESADEYCLATKRDLGAAKKSTVLEVDCWSGTNLQLVIRVLGRSPQFYKFRCQPEETQFIMNAPKSQSPARTVPYPSSCLVPSVEASLSDSLILIISNIHVLALASAFCCLIKACLLYYYSLDLISTCK